MSTTDEAQKIAAATAVATIKSLRGDDPDEVDRLCLFIDRLTELPEGSWALMLRALVAERGERHVKSYRKRRPLGPLPIDDLVPPAEPVAVPDPNAPFWSR